MDIVHKSKFLKCLFVCIFISYLSTCGSRLPRGKRPASLPISAELSALKFLDLATNQNVDVASYMLKNSKQYLVLMFGSVGCSSCNSKALNLSQNYLKKDNLFVDQKYKDFEWIGVNTDTGSNRIKFRSIWDDPEEKKNRGYDFIRWEDVEANTLRSKLLGEGVPFGVPFVAMVNRQGLVWSLNNTSSLALEEMIAKVKRTIDESASSTADAGEQEGDQKKKEEQVSKQNNQLPEAVELSFAKPGRLRSVRVSNPCANGASVDLEEVFSGKKSRLVSLRRTQSCQSEECKKNDLLTREVLASACREGKDETSCLGTFLALDQMACDGSGFLQGGVEFYQVFASLAQWDKAALRDARGRPQRFDEVTSSLTFVFSDTGSLKFFASGVPDKQELVRALRFPHEVVDSSLGMGFQLFGQTIEGTQAPRALTMREWSQGSKYSLLTTFDPSCGSCVEEVKHWLKPESGLYDFCAKDPGFCQIAVLENIGLPEGLVASDYFNEIRSQMDVLGFTKIPLMIDPETIEGGYYRILEGFLFPFLKRWQDNGSVILDQEGKIVYEFTATETMSSDLLVNTLRTLQR